MQDRNRQKHILVIGAGISGVYSAWLLRNSGYEVTVLEASQRSGGRIRHLNGFAPFPIELGAEYIHGSNSDLYRYLRQSGAAFAKNTGEEYLIYDKKAYPVTAIEHLPDVKAYREFYDYHDRYHGDDIRISAFLRQHGINHATLPLYEAWAAELGTDLENLGMASVAKESRQWDSGDENYRLKSAYWLQFQEWTEGLADATVYGAEVKLINYSKEGVECLTADCRRFIGDAVVLTVPITQLKNNKIQFFPALPQNKRQAIERIGMDAGMKVIFKFKEHFWGNMQELIGGDRANEYWSIAAGRHPENLYLTAFAMGARAQILSKKKEKAVQWLLEELDLLYDQKASQLLEKYVICDWSQEPFIQGAYSFLPPGGKGLRKTLSRPVEDRVFFAGEASHAYGYAATVHGAIETAQRVVEEIQELLK